MNHSCYFCGRPTLGKIGNNIPVCEACYRERYKQPGSDEQWKDLYHWIPGWPKSESNKLYLFTWYRGYEGVEIKIAFYDMWFRNWKEYRTEGLIFEKPHYHLHFDLPIFRQKDM